MERRAFLSAISVGSFVGAGCVQIDSQPDQVPIRVKNQTSQGLLGKLEFVEASADEQLISTEFELDSGGEVTYYVEPIHENGEYVASVRLNDEIEEQSILGGRLREITVDILAADDIRISPVET